MNPVKIPRHLRKLRGYKKIKLGGMKFVIQRINPLTDIPTKHLPQIFSHIQMSDKAMRRQFESMSFKKQIENMEPVIRAGVIEPELADNPNDGFVPEDFFRDPMIGFRLFEEIINHSLFRFQGLRGVFFSIVRKLYFYIRGQRYMANLLVSLLSQQEGSQNLKP